MVSKYFLALMLLLGSVCFAHDACEDQQEMVVSITLEEIYVENDTMFLNVNGEALPIKALSREKDGWKATTVDIYYCRNGHSLCKNCKQCHTEKCRFFVKYCNLWK